MTTAQPPPGFMFLSPSAVPPRWADRGIPLVMVPLLPEEASQVLSGEIAELALDDLDQKIAALTAGGEPIAAIARKLGIGERTVDRRLDRLRTHLGLGSKAELTAFLAARGFGVKDRTGD